LFFSVTQDVAAQGDADNKAHVPLNVSLGTVESIDPCRTMQKTFNQIVSVSKVIIMMICGVLHNQDIAQYIGVFSLVVIIPQQLPLAGAVNFSGICDNHNLIRLVCCWSGNSLKTPFLRTKWHLFKRQDPHSTCFNQRVLVGQGPTLSFNSRCSVGAWLHQNDLARMFHPGT
jgi:hypothetical protein